jgi:hypothetical protein
VRKVLLVIGLIVLLAVVGGGVWVLANRGKTTKESVSSVAKQAAKARSHRAKVAPGLRPAEGTYTYTGSGKDNVTLLGGSTHTFPSKVAAVVALDGTGCTWSFNLVYIKEKTNEHDLCTTADGVREPKQNQKTSFLGASQTNIFVCPPPGGLRVPFTGGFEKWDKASGAKVVPGLKWVAPCNTSDSYVDHVVTLVDMDPVQVGSTKVPAWHVHDVATYSRGSKGTDTIDFWWSKTGLPLRIKESEKVNAPSVLGRTDYTTTSDYTLASLTPS